jgi:3-methyladenine DNA glycosylase AlkD
METPDLVRELQVRLEEKSNPKTKAWWEAYLKHQVPFRGVKMGDVRSVLHQWYADRELSARLSPDEQKALALRLFQEAHSEDKIAGILFLQEILLPAGGIDWRDDLDRFADLFAQGWINDWNVCDWFCVKVLGPLVQQEGVVCARAISGWRHAESLWQRRAAGVAFVNLASAGEANFSGFTRLLLEVCGTTVQDRARFAQTGTGWVLRELSRVEPERVIGFIESYICHFSAEGLRYATEKLPAAVKTRLKTAHRGCE